MRADWEQEKLGDFAVYAKGKKPKNQKIKKSNVYKYPYVNIKAFEKGVIESFTDGDKCTFCSTEDFLMVWDGARSGFVGKGINGALGSTLVKMNFPKVENNFAYYFLSSKYLQINSRAKGTGIPHVDPDLLWNYIFPIPALVEQRSIVGKIETLFKELDSGINHLKAAQAQLKIYRQAVLKKAFDGELTKEWREKQTDLPTAKELLTTTRKNQQINNTHLPDWIECDLGDVLEVKRGGSPRPIKKYLTNDKNGINWIKIGDTKNITKYIRKTKEKIKPLGLKKSRLVKQGDFILSNSMSFGKPYIMDCTGAIHDGWLVLKDKHNILDKDFLYHMLGSSFVYIQFNKLAKGSTVKNLNIELVSKVKVKIPSTQEQTQIVKEIENRLTACDETEKLIAESLAKAAHLRQSILKKAFKGELLSDVELAECKKAKDYLPASELLKQIKAEKTLKVKGKKTVKKTQVPIKGISTDIHAGLISKVILLHEQNPKYTKNLTHIKCEKMAHLVETHLQIPLGRKPMKDAAGPDDYPHLKKVEHRARMTGYFTKVTQDIGYTYQSSKNLQKAIDKFDNALSDKKKSEVNKLLELFLKFDLESSEIVATLYAGWNNLLIDGKTPTDNEIVLESRENWSKRKLTIDKNRFYKALNWMRQKDIALIPTGYGTKVVKNGK